MEIEDCMLYATLLRNWDWHVKIPVWSLLSMFKFQNN